MRNLEFEKDLQDSKVMDEVYVDFEETVENLVNLGYQKIIWHNAEKELPDSNRYVLGYDYYGQTYAVVSWDGIDWSDDNIICYNVDYWAELPKVNI